MIAEYKVIPIRETSSPEELYQCDSPALAFSYWKDSIATAPHYKPTVETLAAVFVNTRRRIIGHEIISTGTLDTILVHPREVFRAAIIHGASAIILMHNHPSGDCFPSSADIKATRDLVKAGNLLKIDLLDHIIVSTQTHQSLREIGYITS